ncbi:hypothetical protein [Alloactinosynnema sp. L-07]|uniref:hypothetical protein n=1 Tax=Alloactinosynnema sp. L-07 TaxID=1653480 RepID=UPI00065F06FF|nr:hypothetical protein [Alloactinosynnema sp. L-07]CRK57308.1 hypothetical protein [Alloactinosynnema sp. L-07]
MSNDQSGQHSAHGVDEPVGKLRLFPSVVFGVRAAALTRVALPIGLMAASLVGGSPVAGAEDANIMGTTCCPTITA